MVFSVKPVPLLPLKVVDMLMPTVQPLWVSDTYDDAPDNTQNTESVKRKQSSSSELFMDRV